MANFRVFCGRRAGLMASFKLPSACRRLSGGLVEEPGSHGEPVPAWAFWKQKAEFLQYRLAGEAKQYSLSIAEARLEILEYRYQLKARGIPELFFKSLTQEAQMHCLTKAEDQSLSDGERKWYDALSRSWFPQARKELWKVVFELPAMHEFKNDMQKLLGSEDPELLVEKATSFHKEFHHSHHGGVRNRQSIIFVREHMQQAIRDATVDALQLEGFLKAMAKTIYVNVAFVNQRDVFEEADD